MDTACVPDASRILMYVHKSPRSWGWFQDAVNLRSRGIQLFQMTEETG